MKATNTKSVIRKRISINHNQPVLKIRKRISVNHNSIALKIG